MLSYLSWHSEYHGRGGFSAIIFEVCKKQVEFSCLTGRLMEHTAHVFGGVEFGHKWDAQQEIKVMREERSTGDSKGSFPC